MKSFRRTIWILALGTLSLCIVAGAITAIRNQNLSTDPLSIQRLQPVDKQRLAEALHLKRELGNRVWSGWGESEIPHLLWNRESSFLVGYPELPAGWEVVEGDDFNGEPYFRQDTDEPTNFVVLIDGVLVGSIATKGETDAFLVEMFQEILPPVIESVFPYRLLFQPSEVQISGLLHEDFHVYQITNAREKLDSAESIYPYGDEYWQLDEEMREEWKQEIDLLIDALRSNSNLEKKELIVQFLDIREQRRQEYRLSTEMIDYERKFEWLEGLAKYVEVSIWQQAYQSNKYEPLLSSALDPSFKGYQNFNRRWTMEINQLRRQAGTRGETRFYYTGMAQAILLDDLFPGWKERIFEDDIYLEDLLQAAVLASSQ